MCNEVNAIETKIKDIQKKYNEVASKRNDLIKQIKGCDEEIMKLTGAYQSLMELKESLTKDQTPPVTEPAPEVIETPKAE